MKRVLVLGAGGFLGSAIVAQLRRGDDTVIRGPHQRELDLTRADPKTWDRLLLSTQPDIIINAAGRASAAPRLLSEANLLLVSHLLESLTRLRLTPWLIHLGCAAEYGPAGPPISEDTPCRPISHYGVGKLAATRLLQDDFAHGRARGVVLRVFQPLGQGQPLNSGPGRAALLLRQAVAEQQPELLFQGLETRRDYLDVRDIARAVEATIRLEQMNEPPTLLNVGSGHAWRRRDVVEGLARLAGYSGQISSTPATFVSHQQADIRHFAALGWQPQYTLDDALLTLWQHLPAARRLSTSLPPGATRNMQGAKP